jgi:hypothetical protein
MAELDRKSKTKETTMKKTLLLLFFLTLPILLFSQEKGKLYFELDGVYWEKPLDNTGNLTAEKNRFGSLRPYLGFGLGKGWSLGLMGNYQSYDLQQDELIGLRAIYSQTPDEFGNYPIIDYTQFQSPLGMTNEFFGYGVFVRKSLALGKRTSLNFNFYGMREKSENGNFEVYPNYSSWGYYPCPTCLSYIPYPMKNSFEESNWRFGLDIAFAYELKPWLDLGVRANFLEFKKQTIINNEEIYYVDDYIPNYQYIGLSNYYGDRYYFGSAVAREGIRISLLFQPF